MVLMQVGRLEVFQVISWYHSKTQGTASEK